MNKFSLHLFLICFVILNQATFCVLLRVQYLSEIIYSSQCSTVVSTAGPLYLFLLISYCFQLSKKLYPRSSTFSINLPFVNLLLSNHTFWSYFNRNFAHLLSQSFNVLRIIQYIQLSIWYSAWLSVIFIKVFILL